MKEVCINCLCLNCESDYCGKKCFPCDKYGKGISKISSCSIYEDWVTKMIGDNGGSIYE